MLPPAANVRSSASFRFFLRVIISFLSSLLLFTYGVIKKKFPQFSNTHKWYLSNFWGGGGIIASLPKGRQRRVGLLFYDNCQIVGKTVGVSLDSLTGALMTGRFIGNRPFEGILRWFRETAQHEDHSESTGFKGKLCRHHSG